MLSTAQLLPPLSSQQPHEETIFIIPISQIRKWRSEAKHLAQSQPAVAELGLSPGRLAFASVCPHALKSHCYVHSWLEGRLAPHTNVLNKGSPKASWEPELVLHGTEPIWNPCSLRAPSPVQETDTHQVIRDGPVATSNAVLDHGHTLGHMNVWTQEQHLTFFLLCAASRFSFQQPLCSQPGGQNPWPS